MFVHCAKMFLLKLKNKCLLSLLLTATCLSQDAYIIMESKTGHVTLTERTKSSTIVCNGTSTEIMPGTIQFYRQRYFNNGYTEVTNTTKDAIAPLEVRPEKQYAKTQTYFPAAVAAQKQALHESRVAVAQQIADQRKKAQLQVVNQEVMVDAKTGKTTTFVDLKNGNGHKITIIK
jgi:hypothetical protein